MGRASDLECKSALESISLCQPEFCLFLQLSVCPRACGKRFSQGVCESTAMGVGMGVHACACMSCACACVCEKRPAPVWELEGPCFSV